MLKRLIDEVKEYDYHVIDDGSDYDLSFIPPERINSLPHLGKNYFYLIYNLGMRIAKNSNHDNFLFLQDDVCNVNFDKIKELHDEFKNTRYFVNATNDGRDSCWVSPNFQAPKYKGLKHTGFYDCGGLTNRKTLEGFTLTPPNELFKQEKSSSGVGFQFTKHFNGINVPMYTPNKSLVFHGDHPSVMHPKERLRNKLISK